MLSFQPNTLTGLKPHESSQGFYTGGHRSPVWGERHLFELEEGTKNFKLEASLSLQLFASLSLQLFLSKPRAKQNLGNST